jgi:dTDP-4-dehydrorhamnose 3,5-epimerase
MASFVSMPTSLAGLIVVQRKRLEDMRGFFSRLFCADELSTIGFSLPIAQINQTLTRKRGAVRGLHFQYPPHAEDKFVSCLHGEIFDVAVDLRRESPTFLKWHAETLSANNGRSLLIPQGFAHGFQTLTEECELIYLHSKPYASQAEGALNAKDPMLNIGWPLAFTDISERDSAHPLLLKDFNGI